MSQIWKRRTSARVGTSVGHATISPRKICRPRNRVNTGNAVVTTRIIQGHDRIITIMLGKGGKGPLDTTTLMTGPDVEVVPIEVHVVEEGVVVGVVDVAVAVEVVSLVDTSR